jgi:hypothetical protein
MSTAAFAHVGEEADCADSIAVRNFREEIVFLRYPRVNGFQLANRREDCV